MNEIQRSKAVAICHDYLLKRGIDVQIVNNLDTVADLASTSAKPYLTPLVSPDHNDLTPANSIWIVGLKSGDPVMLGGAKLEIVDRGEIAALWSSVFQRAYGAKISNVSKEIQLEVDGRVAYFGDMFIDPKCGAGLLGARAFTAIGHLITFARWSQNWTYAFMHEKDVMRGAGLRYGFNRFVPQPFDWDENPPETRSDREFCALVSDRDFWSMIRSTVRALQIISEV